MDEVAVRIENLSHRYARDWVIEDLSLDITRSGILGLLGSNGAGKSTLMNIMCGVLYQTGGEVFINGINVRENPLQAKQQIGFLPQQAPLHAELTVDEYLSFCAEIRNVEPKKTGLAVAAAKARCGIVDVGRRLIRNLSGGYRQRVGIAQAIIHKPNLVVLDEPTSGLDPNQVLAVRELIKGIAEEQSVILSTHILSEVQAICDKINMIEHGRIVFSGTMRQFNDQIKPNSMLLALANPPNEREFCLIDGINGAETVNDEHVRLRFEGGWETAERVIEACVTKGWKLRELSLERSSLDEIFARLSGHDDKRLERSHTS